MLLLLRGCGDFVLMRCECSNLGLVMSGLIDI